MKCEIERMEINYTFYFFAFLRKMIKKLLTFCYWQNKMCIRDSSKAEKHILDDEKEARSYFDQLWAEVMEIYWSTENKSSLLKFSKEMEQEISEYRKQFTQEDTMAGMIQGLSLIHI